MALRCLAPFWSLPPSSSSVFDWSVVYSDPTTPAEATQRWVDDLPPLDPPTSIAELKAALDTLIRLPVSKALAAQSKESNKLYVDQHGTLLSLLQSTDCVFELPPFPRSPTELSLPSFHDRFILNVLLLVLRHFRIPFDYTRNSADISGVSSTRSRPDLVVWISQQLVFKCEDKSTPADLPVAARELTDKLAGFVPAVWGRLPFVLAYASGGATVQFFAVDRKLKYAAPIVVVSQRFPPFRSHPLTDQLDLTSSGTFGISNRISVITATVNMARVLGSWHRAGLLQKAKLPLHAWVPFNDNRVMLCPSHVLKESPPAVGFEVSKNVYAAVRERKMPHVVSLKEGTEVRGILLCFCSFLTSSVSVSTAYPQEGQDGRPPGSCWR